MSDGDATVADGAVLHGDVRLGRGARIGRGCILDGDIAVGDGTRIDDYCTVRGRVKIGPGNWIYPFCTIGADPQHSAHPEDPSADPAESPASGSISVGSDNIIREYSAIHLPAVDASTSVGSRCHLLSYSHVAHGCAVGDSVTMSNGATIGGHSSIGDGANLGFNVSVHPSCRIGAYAMVAMTMPVVRDVPPYALVDDQRFAGVNEEGMKRGGMTPADIADVRAAYERIGRRGVGGGSGRFDGELRRFVEASKRGCYMPALAGSAVGGVADKAPEQAG